MKRFLRLLFPFSLIFFETRLYSTFTITDAFLVLLVISAILSANKKADSYPQKNKWKFYLGLFFVVSLSGFLFAERQYFSMSVFINSEFRIVLYSLALLLIPKIYYTEKNFRTLINGLLYTLLIFVMFGFIDFVSIQLGLGLNYNISFVDDIGDSKRLRGLVSEPAHFGVFVGLISSLLIYYYRKHGTHSIPKNGKKILIFSFIVVLLSRSIVGLVFLMIVFLPHLYQLLWKSIKKANFLVILSTTIILSGVTVVIYTMNSERIVEILENNDASGNHRMIGTWTLTAAGLIQYDSYWLGLGTGESGSYISEHAVATEGLNIYQGISLSNLFSMILLQNGFIGLGIFVLFSYFFYKERSLPLFLVFIVYGFSICEFGALMWSFFVLSEIVLHEGNESLFSR